MSCYAPRPMTTRRGDAKSTDERPAIARRHHDRAPRRSDLDLRDARALESLEFGLERQVAELVMEPLRHQVDPPLLVFDLSKVDYFGSMFLALLLRCWKLALRAEG